MNSSLIESTVRLSLTAGHRRSAGSTPVIMAAQMESVLEKVDVIG